MNQFANQSAKTSRALENLVDFITGFRRDLELLAKLYGQMPALIAAEHEAVISGNFILVRESSGAKMLVCDEITSTHGALIDLSRRLPRISEALTGDVCPVPATLSECLRRLVDLSDAASSDQNDSPSQSLTAMTRDVLQRLLAGSASSLEAFLDVAEAVKPRMEANRVLLQKLAQSYQDSYRFWIEMAAETQAPYDARGLQRSSSVASGIRIKA